MIIAFTQEKVQWSNSYDYKLCSTTKGYSYINLGPTLPAFLSPNVARVLVENFEIVGIGTVDEDIKMFLG